MKGTLADRAAAAGRIATCPQPAESEGREKRLKHVMMCARTITRSNAAVDGVMLSRDMCVHARTWRPGHNWDTIASSEAVADERTETEDLPVAGRCALLTAAPVVEGLVWAPDIGALHGTMEQQASEGRVAMIMAGVRCRQIGLIRSRGDAMVSLVCSAAAT